MEHLITICPRNKNPESITQQRIRAGIVTGEPSTPMGLDRHRPAYGNSRKRYREPSMDDNANPTYTYKHYGASKELELDGQMNPERRALLEHTRQPSQPEYKAGTNKGSYHSSPLAKRARKRVEGQRERLRERAWPRSQKSHMPRGQSPSIGSNDGGSTELLPQLTRRSNEMAGRLSPWDDGCSDSKMSQSDSPSSKRPVASDFWRSDNPDTTIQLQFPHADATWVSDMTSFDVDSFFDELDIFMETRAVARDVEERQAVPGLNLGDSGVTMAVDECDGPILLETGS